MEEFMDMSNSVTKHQPLTGAQSGIWYGQQMDPENPIYNTGEYIEITAPLDFVCFEKALRQAVEESESLHVRFGEDIDGPWQMIGTKREFQLHFIDVSAESDPRGVAESWMRADFKKPLDLKRDLLFNQALFKISQDRYFWYQRIHHIAADAYGFSLIAQRVAKIYTSLVTEQPLTEEALDALQPVLDENQSYHESKQYELDRQFWMNRFSDHPEVVSLGEPAPKMSNRFTQHTDYLSIDALDRLKQTARQHRGSWYEMIIASMAIYMHRLTGTNDVVLSLPMMCRMGTSAVRVPAMVMNLLPLHLSLRPDMTFVELFEQVKQEMREVRKHQYYRYETLRRDLKLLGDNQRLFGPQINMMPFDYALNFAGNRGITHKLSTGPVDDLSLNIYDQHDGNGVRVDLDANPDVYSDQAVARHLRRLLHVIENVSKLDENLAIARVDLLLPEERLQVLGTWNDTSQKLANTSAQELFEKQVLRSPMGEALKFNGNTLHYAVLDEKVNRLAHLLQARGLGPEQFVAIALPRSEDMVIAMLAVLKTGAAYLPIDPDYPIDRITYMLEDAKPAYVITNKAMKELLAESQVPQLILDDLAIQAELSRYVHIGFRAQSVSGQHPAYMIYTSGSTGKPKGVVVTTEGLVNFLLSMKNKISLGEQDSLLAVTTIAFDISALEVFLPLISGATCVIAEKVTTQDPNALAGMIDANGITIMQATPTHWHALVSSCPNALRGLRVLVGGEALSSSLTEALHQLDCEITNLYGPTETTIWSTAIELNPRQEGTPSIGQPIENTQLYILDAGLQPLPTGVAGDLYIAGTGLARGYLGRPDLTAARFVANPFGAFGERMYQTGDIARWRANGTLEYVSRSDHQLKVRGFRIEPGEIEAVLSGYTEVSQVAVIVREDQPGDKRVVAYIVPQHNKRLDVGELRLLAKHYLPDYMVPSAFVVIDTLPLTPNKKIDRKALPAPDLQGSVSGRDPRTPQEEILCDLFMQVLDLPRVGIDDSFFDLGGHSLLAAHLMNRIRDVFDVELGIGKLFDTPTVAGLVEQLDHGKQVRPPVKQVEKPDEIPLSFAQRRLWFLYRLEGPSPTYNIPVVVQLSGKLNQDALQAALIDVVARHESLRTIFPEKEGTAKQLILDTDQAVPTLHVHKIGTSALADNLNKAVRYRFHLDAEPAFRVELFKLGVNKYVLLLLVHHIVGDGWSLTPLTSDLKLAYKERFHGNIPKWATLPVQYADYALWQDELLGNEQDQQSLVREQLEYWKKELANLPDHLALPTDFPRPAESSYQGDTYHFTINPALHRNLTELARKNGASLFMVLQAGLTALLTRLGAGDDIPLGSPVAGRNDDALGELIGLFINTLVLRTDTSGDPSFRELVDRVRKVNINAYENQDLPFERLVEVLNPVRSRSKHPLFQIMLALQNTPDPNLDLAGMESDLSIRSVGSAKFDLTLEFRENVDKGGKPDGLDGFLEYSTDLFKRNTIEIMMARFSRLLEDAVTDQDKPIGRLEILAYGEQQKLLTSGSKYTKDVPATCLPVMFEEQAALRPKDTALVFENKQLSYGALNERANQLAHLLIQKGVGPEDFVALALPRSLEMVVGLLGILKAGAGYVPLDPNYPSDRIAFMMKDSHPVFVITNEANADKLPDMDLTPCIVLDGKVTKDALNTMSVTNPMDSERVQPLSPLHPAYIIYTSGSTGVPKGVIIPHQNVIRLLGATAHWFQFDANDVWTLFHSYAFDFSVWEMWGPLLYGGRLVIVPHEMTRSPVDFLKLLVQESVTVLNQTPSAFYQLMQADREHAAIGQQLSLRYVIFGGEALEQSRLEDWYSRHADDAPKLINMYGITETTVHVTYIELDEKSVGLRANSIIGQGIPDLDVYVLDDSLQPVPTGVVGELYVSGAGLARGYLGRPDLTADRFVANPYGPSGTRMYRTGDLARWKEYGTLDYMGRADQQIKIRGFRIELGEIEFVLAQHTAIGQVTVVAREDQPGDQRLVGYIVLNTGENVDGTDLRSYAAKCLPDYMVPSAFVELNSLPLTANGKLDHKALPKPDYIIESDSRGPRTPQEEMLCDLFMEVLDLPRVGIDDEFFHLGGHSLLAVKLMTRIREALGVELSIGNLFESPTVAGLAKRLEVGDNQSALDVLLPLRKSGNQLPMFCVHPAGGLSWCYAGLMTALGKDYPIYGLQARGISERGKLPKSIDEMAADYIEQMQKVQPHGPYHLLGWSLGGNVIQAMATQLQKQGEEIALIIMLDAYPSHFLPIKQAPDDEEALVALLALGGYDPDSLGDKPLDFEHALELLREDGSALASLEDETIRSLKETYVNSVQNLSEYEPKSFHGDILFFRSTIIPEWFDPISTNSWEPYINGQIEVYDINCRHKDMCQPEPLAEIGEVIANKLTALNDRVSIE